MVDEMVERLARRDNSECGRVLDKNEARSYALRRFLDTLDDETATKPYIMLSFIAGWKAREGLKK